jgi:hypothetical protein
MAEMHFVYQGFTHQGDRRCFLFRGVDESNPPIAFSIEIDLLLLSQKRIPVQDGPTFCLQMLTSASLAGMTYLEKLRSYRVIDEDFRPLLIERERQAAQKALRKPPRKPFRKPSAESNLRGLGTP